jgi:hypothetical protein
MGAFTRNNMGEIGEIEDEFCKCDDRKYVTISYRDMAIAFKIALQYKYNRRIALANKKSKGPEGIWWAGLAYTHMKPNALVYIYVYASNVEIALARGILLWLRHNEITYPEKRIDASYIYTYEAKLMEIKWASTRQVHIEHNMLFAANGINIPEAIWYNQAHMPYSAQFLKILHAACPHGFIVENHKKYPAVPATSVDDAVSVAKLYY